MAMLGEHFETSTICRREVGASRDVQDLPFGQQVLLSTTAFSLMF